MIKRTAPLAETIKKRWLDLWSDERGGVGDMDEGGDPDPAAETTDPPPDTDPAVEAADADPPPADFLTVNDRTSYKTSEAAIEGFGKASDRIQEYSQHGTPQEIADRMLELRHIKEVAAGKTDKAEDPYKDYGDDEKPQWQAFDKKFPAAAKRMGYLTADEVKETVGEQVRETLESNRKFDEAGKHFVDQSNLRGIPMGPGAMSDFESRGGTFYRDNPQAKALWDNNDTKGFVDLFFTNTYGEASSSPSPPGDPAPGRERGTDGKFIAKATTYEQAKQAANRLPKAPPNGSAAPTRSADELSPEDRRDPRKRLLRAKQHFEERTASAGV